MKTPAPGSLQIFSGLLKGRKLPVPSQGVRPTPGKIRQALFNILANDLADTTWLELFAGTGAIGFEAYSRGASKVVLVENQASACALIAANIKKFNCGHAVSLYQSTALLAVKHASVMNRLYDFIFLDPPYEMWNQGLETFLLEACVEKIKPDGMIISQSDKKQPVMNHAALNLFEQRQYGRNILNFFTKLS